MLITCTQLQETIDLYKSFFIEHAIEIELPHVIQKLNEFELLQIIDRFDGVIAGDDEFTARVLEKGKRLKVIAKWGVGVDGIDVETAKRLGIHVYNTPNVFNDEVADVVMGYIILLSRQLHKIDLSIHDGKWLKIQGVSLAGKTLGIIGMGSIGRALARRAVSSRMNIIGYDLAPVDNALIREIGICMTTLDELLQNSDFISLNCNLTTSNCNMIGREEFSLMKTGVFIINTARGPLINEEALIQALRDGKVAGAALDVFKEEPLPIDSLLREFDNCVFGSHNSSNTYEAVIRTNELAIQNLLKGLEN